MSDWKEHLHIRLFRNAFWRWRDHHKDQFNDQWPSEIFHKAFIPEIIWC